jgi:hypothetical protein
MTLSLFPKDNSIAKKITVPKQNPSRNPIPNRTSLPYPRREVVGQGQESGGGGVDGTEIGGTELRGTYRKGRGGGGRGEYVPRW